MRSSSFRLLIVDNFRNYKTDELAYSSAPAAFQQKPASFITLVACSQFLHSDIHSRMPPQFSAH
ncbi:hypothetical protein HMPREF0293_2540 [Corynebacterium glucuronolyticum ATCC 51866]|uniref:Isochorismatase-like domain-containing protein n=1 Tax=Corynebacterium glucuronolyticum ATCC 51866 TaxID=548478 RepID=A0ABP2DPV4_9CORY|nr:hypothetical protein HMPREF0293_2540 [Corynebacterium glucuronolyticum ATCC 51866]